MNNSQNLRGEVARRVSRRMLLTGVGAALLLTKSAGAMESLYDGESRSIDPALLPPPESPIDFPIEPQDLSEIPPEFHRQIVPWDGLEEPGTVVVDPARRFLFLVLDSGESALRYGVGVGRAGFAWSGDAVIQMKRRWPRWVPPDDMIGRDERAKKWANGMPGGPENPLGARALYLYSNGEDTLYRIHGTNEPQSIGKAMSSGCIRMLNQDVDELYLRVEIGTRVVVSTAETPSDLSTSAL